MLRLGVFETAYLIAAGKPFELLGRDDDIAGMRAAGKLATARTVTILKHTHMATYFIPHFSAKTTATRDLVRHFGTSRSQRLFSVIVAHRWSFSLDKTQHHLFPLAPVEQQNQVFYMPPGRMLKS